MKWFALLVATAAAGVAGGIALTLVLYLSAMR